MLGAQYAGQASILVKVLETAQRVAVVETGKKLEPRLLVSGAETEKRKKAESEEAEIEADRGPPVDIPSINADLDINQEYLEFLKSKGANIDGAKVIAQYFGKESIGEGGTKRLESLASAFRGSKIYRSIKNKFGELNNHKSDLINWNKNGSGDFGR